MASFREHVSIGALVSVVGVVLVYFYALLTDPVLLGLLFVVGVIASFLPDLDSDTSLPFYLIFGTCSFAVTGLVLYRTLLAEPTDWYVLIGVPLSALIFMWVVVGGIFKRFTKHRGIMHSLPAALICGVLAYLAAERLGEGEVLPLVFASMTAVGYLSHLVLDELHAGINIDGTLFRPKRSLGSALKLFAPSKRITLLTYVLLAALLYQAFV